MKTIKGDLVKLALDGEFDVIVHGCNCFCTMGAGIARQIAETFPMAEKVDRATISGDKDKLGCCTISWHYREDGSALIILNGYTQYFIASSENPNVVSYDAVQSVFNRIASICKNPNKSMRVGYPAIGAGLAGGDWNVISAIIEGELKGLDHTFVEYDGGQ